MTAPSPDGDGSAQRLPPGAPGRASLLPGQAPLVAAALTIGILLLGIQLWILTVALDLYLAGEGDQVALLSVVSGVIFLGGLLVLWMLGRRPRVHHPGVVR